MIRNLKEYNARSGKPIGIPALEIPAIFKKYYVMWKEKEITEVVFARLLDVSRPTLYRYVREFENK